MSDEERAVSAHTRKVEAAVLKRIWLLKHGAMSQAQFAGDYGLGTQGNVGHYLNGRRPLNLETAEKFAKALGCQVGDFSPRLAAELARRDARGGWPFPRITRERWEALSGGQKEALEGIVLGQIMDWEHPPYKSAAGGKR